MGHLPLCQRRGRFVHDQYVGFIGDRLGDLDHLPIGDRKIADLCLRVDGDVQTVEQFRRLAVHFLMIDEAETGERFASDPDVLGHRHRRHQVQFLVDHGDAVFQRVERRLQLDLDTLELHAATVGMINAGEDLHQRRLARAVFAHQRVHAAPLQPERHVIERDDTREFLAHALGGQKIFGIGDCAALAHCGHRGRADHGNSPHASCGWNAGKSPHSRILEGISSWPGSP